MLVFENITTPGICMACGILGVQDTQQQHDCTIEALHKALSNGLEWAETRPQPV